MPWLARIHGSAPAVRNTMFRSSSADRADDCVICPDVAAVKVRQRPVTLEGRPIEDQPEGSPTYIMAKEGAHWCLVAGQNTLIADP